MANFTTFETDDEFFTPDGGPCLSGVIPELGEYSNPSPTGTYTEEVCEDCPNECQYECKILVDGVEVDILELGLDNAPCACDLEVSNLSAKRCRSMAGELRVGFDLYDRENGFVHPMGTILEDDGYSETLTVKCKRKWE